MAASVPSEEEARGAAVAGKCPESAGAKPSEQCSRSGDKKPQRPRSALFGGVRPEGRLYQRAMALMREQHNERMRQQAAQEKAAAREERSKTMRAEKEKFRERLAQQQEKHVVEERENRHKRAEAARKRAQRRRVESATGGEAGRPISGDPRARPSTVSQPADFVRTPSFGRPDSAPVPRRSRPSVQADNEPSSSARDPSSPTSPSGRKYGTTFHTLYIKYRGMPRSQAHMPVSLTADEFGAMTIAQLKAHIASVTGVHSHTTCLLLHDTVEGFIPLQNDGRVCEQLENGAVLMLQMNIERNRADMPEPGSARQMVNEGWIQQQGRTALWRGHHMDVFPFDLYETSREVLVKMLRQASVKVNTLLRDEDLRTQLAEAAPVWEVERILACETPDQVLRVPADSAPMEVKAAFRRVSMLVHPDKNQAEGASKAMQAVTGAFRSLYLEGGVSCTLKSAGGGTTTRTDTKTPPSSDGETDEPPAPPARASSARASSAPRPPAGPFRAASSRFGRRPAKKEAKRAAGIRPQSPRWGWAS